MKVYRLVKDKFSSVPLSSDGAKLYGGRWNSKGTAVLYSSDSISLTALETLVHVHLTTVLNAYTCITIALADDAIMILGDDDLPDDWRDDPIPFSTMNIGDQWLTGNNSLALSVPSTLIPRQRNFLINPNHADFEALNDTIETEPFLFDSRLVKSEKPT